MTADGSRPPLPPPAYSAGSEPSGDPSQSADYQVRHIEGWIKALNGASCCSTPDPEAKTLREWDALATRSYPPLPWRRRVGNRVIDAVFCTACLRLRISPVHWFPCGGG